MAAPFACSPVEAPASDITYRTDASGSTQVLIQGSPLLAHDAAYRELLAQLPLSSHPKPLSCLLLGGSDTLVLSELLKIPQLQRVTVLDAQPVFSCLARRYLPGGSAALNDPRVELRLISAEELQNFLDFSVAQYDAIVVDRGVAGMEWSRDLLDSFKGLLKPGGSLVAPLKSPWQHMSLVKQIYGDALKVFPNVSFGFCGLYEQEGTVGFLVACLDAKRNLRAARRTVKGIMYWSPAIQAACFSLPKIASDALLQVEEENARHQPAPSTLLDNYYSSSASSSYGIYSSITNSPTPQPLGPTALRERFRLAQDRIWMASGSVGMNLKVSPHRPLFAEA